MFDDYDIGENERRNDEYKADQNNVAPFNATDLILLLTTLGIIIYFII